MTFPFWMIPLLITVVLLIVMLRPLHGIGDDFGGGFEALFRVLWLIPILAVWCVYFAVLAYTK